MKLHIMEDFESTTSIGTQINPISNIFTTGDFEDYAQYADLDSCIGEVCDTCECGDIYEDLEALGFIFIMASNDIHTVHVNACGHNFKELHESADELYKLLNEYADTCLEMCCENGHYIHNINQANELLTNRWETVITNTGYSIEEGTQLLIDVLHQVTLVIAELYPCCPSDIQSTLDEWTRELTSQMNYFLKRVVECPTQTVATNESMMLRNTRHDKPIIVCEKLDKLKVGQPYKMFCQVEDHIEDYNVDPLTLKKGDYIIRDFQFGHLPNGGNKGYIPYEVTDIVYDNTSDSSGYYDRRTRLELDDGKDYFYIVVQNDRFNGMFHKLKKSSMQD